VFRKILARMSSSPSSSSSSLSLSSLPAAAAASETGSGSGRGAAAAETKDPTTDPAWFAAPRTIDSAWDLAKIAHHQTLPEYDPATRSFVWRRDESGATEICGSIATWQQSCPRVEVSVWRVDRAIGRPIMCYRSSASWGSSCEVELWSPDSASSGGGGGAKARTRTMVYQSEQLVYDIDKSGLEWPPIERKLLIDDACGLMPPAPTKSSGSAERDLADAELERERQARLGFRKIARTMCDSGWTAEFIRKAPVAAHASSSAPPPPSSSTASTRISSVMWSRADTSTRTEQRVPTSICATTETDLFAPEKTDAPPAPPSSPPKKVAPSSSPSSSSSSSSLSSSPPPPRAEPDHGLSAEGIAEGRRLLRLLHGSM
jgi:hypothetical protein